MSGFFGDDDAQEQMQQQIAEQNAKQEKLLKQQEAEKAQKESQLERQRIDALRGRFGGTASADADGGGVPSGNSSVNTSVPMDLFGLITGQR
jgi:hypothetical protein